MDYYLNLKTTLENLFDCKIIPRGRSIQNV
jgi:hypothetical protein